MAAWSDNELTIIVSDYLDMLKQELDGKPVNKTDHRARIKPLLDSRSDGSIEFKHQNISAVMIRSGRPYIKGYKPRWNYQVALEDEVERLILKDLQEFSRLFDRFVEYSPKSIPVVNDFARIVDSPPEGSMVTEKSARYQKGPVKLNYLEREQRHTALGMGGEALVMEFEKWRLRATGLEKYVDKIEWISQEDDSAGFDILSRNEDGSDRYTEDKTTKLAKETPIFFTRNEFAFAEKKHRQYNLYRLYNFSELPRLFFLNGEYDSFCRKEATQYIGYF